ncbi:MAG TPA: hypothetical protein VGX78_06525 [Pirellulales bacterium]|jgi:hypothetical protein|nr:hypothetical protein [Pirellulales bacterium]
MTVEDRNQRRADAAAEFDRKRNRQDGAFVVNSLADGLSTLRDALFTRVHADVEKIVGMDSILSPAAADRSAASARTEIELYQIAESASSVEVDGYVPDDAAWYRQWLARLRLGERCQSPVVAGRLEHYRSKTADERRRAFAQLLERSLPEARHAPLIVYRLFPLAVAVATAVAFGDHSRAGAARNRQVFILPGISDCPTCHGRVLANEEKCAQCGNPFWTYEWLTAD